MLMWSDLCMANDCDSWTQYLCMYVYIWALFISFLYHLPLFV